MTNAIREELKRRRLERMRMGQEAGLLASLWSDPEIRILLVPLTEAESDFSWMRAAMLDVPENAVGAQMRDREIRRCDIWQACRLPDDYRAKVWPSVEDMIDELANTDVNFLAEQYLMLIENSSPSLDGLTDKEVDELKKVWQAIELNALAGKSWRAAKLFLSTVSQDPRAASFFGSTSTGSLIGTNGVSESILNAGQS